MNKLRGPNNFTSWWNFKHFLFSPQKLGEDEPILPHIFQINIGSTTNQFSIQTSQAKTVSSCHRNRGFDPTKRRDMDPRRKNASCREKMLNVLS